MPAKILFVDDVPEIRERYAALLGRRYTVETAADGVEALERLERDGPFEVVVSDHEMPEMEGAELLGRVHERWPDSVGILMTGILHVEVAVRAVNEGRIFRFLQKPCAAQALWSSLEAAVAENEARRGLRERHAKLESSRNDLERFAGVLQERVSHHAQVLARLHRFAVDLNPIGSIQTIAEYAAEAISDVLDVPGVQIELCERYIGGRESCEARLGTVDSDGYEVPIETDEGRIGTIRVAGAAQGVRLTDSDFSALATIAQTTSVAAHSQIRRRELDEAKNATIFALAELAERRDNETGRHLERVSRYCALVAEGLREAGLYEGLINERFVEDIYRCAPMHDIGKVGIPDSILLKKDRLNEQEWRIMKTHTDIGAATLRAVIASHGNQSFLQMSMEIAWCHHEKWDGSGYPRGLSGNQIPLSARILALADVYDALTSSRPYKEPWSHERALDWIRSRTGTHFDPDVVAVFVHHAEQAEEICLSLADPPAGECREPLPPELAGSY